MKFSNEIKMIEYWKRTNNILEVPRDDYERVKRHYYGVNIWYRIGILNRLLKNIIAALLLPLAYFKSFRESSDEIKEVEMIITSPNKLYLLNDQDIPACLIERYSSYVKIANNLNSLRKEFKNISLDADGRNIIRSLIKHFPFSFFMNLSVMLHLSRVTRIINQYKCKAIVTTQTEQDFTTSLLTKYCELKGVKYIGVQHGEYCYNPSMSYMRFSEYFAWNRETIDILELTNTKIPNVQIYTPERLKPTCQKKSNPNYYITYYLSGEDKEKFYKIKAILLRFCAYGYKCCVRPHPRHTNISDLIKVFDSTGIDIENCNDISIEDSICNTRYIVAYRSTVLSQGYINSMPIVIDDIVGDIDYLNIVNDINIIRADMKLSELINELELIKS